MAKRTVRANYNEEELSLEMQFLNPSEDEDGEPEVVSAVEFDFNTIPEDMQKRTCLFGLHQFLVQRSGPTGTSLEEKQENMEEAFGMLVEGKWNARVGGGYGNAIPIAAMALARHYNVDDTVGYNTWKSLDSASKEKVKANPAIQSLMEEIKAESKKAPATIELGDLLGG